MFQTFLPSFQAVFLHWSNVIKGHVYNSLHCVCIKTVSAQVHSTENRCEWEASTQRRVMAEGLRGGLYHKSGDQHEWSLIQHLCFQSIIDSHRIKQRSSVCFCENICYANVALQKVNHWFLWTLKQTARTVYQCDLTCPYFFVFKNELFSKTQVQRTFDLFFSSRFTQLKYNPFTVTSTFREIHKRLSNTGLYFIWLKSTVAELYKLHCAVVLHSDRITGPLRAHLNKTVEPNKPKPWPAEDSAIIHFEQK